MSGSGPSEQGRLPEKGLGLALEILEQVARHNQQSSAADIARAVGAPRATVYRIVNALVRDEYLVRRPDFSGFYLGSRVLELAAVVDAHRAPAHRSIIERARADTGEALHFFGFHDAGVVILDEDPQHPLSNRVALLEDPARSATGHLWLVERSDRPSPDAPRWQVAAPADDIAAIAEAYAIRGYTEQVAMLSPNRGCLAVPIRDHHSNTIGAVSLATSITRMSVAARHVTALRDVAAALAGHVPALV